MNSDIQLSMPLIDHSSLNFAKGSTDVNTGEQVIYRGFINGGPTSGTKSCRGEWNVSSTLPLRSSASSMFLATKTALLLRHMSAW